MANNRKHDIDEKVGSQPGRSKADDDRGEDRTADRMAAQNKANEQAARAEPQDGRQIEQGSHGRVGMGQARQSDGS